MEFEEVILENENVERNAEEEEERKDNTDQMTSSSSSSSTSQTKADRYVSDVIKVSIIPEKKGNFIKHTAYEIRSENNNCTVERRYNDFLSFYESLLKVYEYRLIPRLPPKQFMLDAFLEERRIGLNRWLLIVSQHAIISKDIMLKHFLTECSFQVTSISSEFCDFLSRKIQSLKINDMDEVVKLRNKTRIILNKMISLKRLLNEQSKREVCQADDFAEMCETLNDLMKSTNDDGVKDFCDNFGSISKLSENSAKSGAIGQLELIIDILTGYNDACDRVVNLKDISAEDKFNGNKIKNILRGNAMINEEDSETRQRRILFAIHCVIEEFKLVEKYLKLLPSILLKFTYQESQTFSQISAVFQKILEIESDKLN